MKHILSVFCVFVILVASTIAEGAFCTQATAVNEVRTVIVFGNGIMNTQQDADDSRIGIKNSLQAVLSEEEFNRLEFAVAYNPSYGLLNDLYESLKQRVSTDTVVVSFWRWLAAQEALPPEVQQEFMRTAGNFDYSTLVAPDDLANHLQLYRTKILEGKKVVVVSHSQGNFFANAAHQLLYSGSEPIRSRSFGIVAVATPASFVAGNGPYTTLVEDGVIASVLAATAIGISPPLGPNVTNILSGAATGDWRGHSFLESYMAEGSRSVAKIIPDILSVMMSLVQPSVLVQDGVITVTLTWVGNSTDVDLHVLEPDGTHVYYFTERGKGFLDLDDMSGFGPEHYYVSCGALVEGRFRIGVNYYYGPMPERAFVQVAAGTLVRGFEVVLPFARGIPGDTDPLHIADIVVTRSPMGGFDFEIWGPP